MNIRKLGFWSSTVCLSSFLAYTVCFIAIYLINPGFTWTNADDFIRYSNAYPQLFKYIAMASMLIFSLSFIIQLVCLKETVEVSKRYLAGAAAHFATAFSALICMSYFVQISSIRMQTEAGQSEGISQFVQSNPASFINGVILLGWTVFFGIACLLASSAMGCKRKERIVKYAMRIDGFMMLASSIAYIFNIKIVLGLFMFIGLGAATITFSAALCTCFKANQPVNAARTAS